jgi:hypothetical protein
VVNVYAKIYTQKSVGDFDNPIYNYDIDFYFVQIDAGRPGGYGGLPQDDARVKRGVESEVWAG